MDKPEQRVVFSKKLDEPFVKLVEKHEKANRFPSFKRALMDLAYKGLSK